MIYQDGTQPIAPESEPSMDYLYKVPRGVVTVPRLIGPPIAAPVSVSLVPVSQNGSPVQIPVQLAPVPGGSLIAPGGFQLTGTQLLIGAVILFFLLKK